MTMTEMFLIQVESEKKCSISHYDQIRGIRYLRQDGDGWKLVAKEVTSDSELWTLKATEYPAFDEEKGKEEGKDKEKEKEDEKGKGKEKEKDKEKEAEGNKEGEPKTSPRPSASATPSATPSSAPKQVCFLIQGVQTQHFMRCEKTKVVAAPKDFTPDEAAVFQVRYYGVS